MPSRKKIFFILAAIVVVDLILQTTAVSFAQSELEDPSFKEKKAQEGYILNLKDLIKQSKDKIEKVDDELQEQARKRRNQQREEKAREYFEKAMRLHEEGKLEEAQEFWQKAIKITEHPEMKDYISENAKKTRRQEQALQKEELRNLKRLEIERGYSAAEVEKAYQVAVSLFKQKKFIEAQSEFERVDEMFPDHKATRSYLMIIDQEIKSEQDQLIEERMREEAIAKKKEKEEWRKELELKEKARQENVIGQAETLYQEALSLYKVRQFERAKDKFKEIEWIRPGYKSAEKYLSRIDKDIEVEQRRLMEEQKLALLREAKEEKISAEKEKQLQAQLIEREEKEKMARLKDEADFVYDTAISLYKSGDYLQSKEKFEEVRSLFPAYKATDKYLTMIDKKLVGRNASIPGSSMVSSDAPLSTDSLNETQDNNALSLQQEKQRLKELEIQAKSLYGVAVDLYNSQLYSQSLDKFNELQVIAPNYKATSKYLAKINQKLNIPEKAQKPFDEFAFKPNEGTATQLSQASEAQPLPTLVVEDKTVSEAEAQRRKQFESDAENKYRQAMAFYKNNDFMSAKHKFIQVEAIYPGYKDTLNYLAKLDDMVMTKEKGAPKKNVTKIQKSEEVSVRVVKEKPAAAKKEKEPKEEKSRVVPAPVPPANQITEDLVKSRYGEALELYKDKQYAHAKAKFLEVENMNPDYKSTQSYLNKIYTILEKEAGINDLSQETYEWELFQDERVALLKAKEEHLEDLEGERYQEFKKMIEEERRAIKEVEKERKRRDALRRKNVKNRWRAEESAKMKEQAAAEKAEAMKVQEEKRLSQAQELAEKKRLEQEEKERIKKEEADRLAKIKEEKLRLEQLKEEQKQKELEAKRIAEEVENQQKKMLEQEALAEKQKADETARKEQLVKSEEKEKQALEQRKQKAEDIEAQKDKLLDQYAMSDYKEEINEKKAAKYRAIVAREKARNQKELKKKLAQEQKAIQKYLKQNESKRLSYKTANVEEIYREGIDLYKKGNFPAAKAKFSMVRQIYPGYKSVDSYLDGAERQVTFDDLRIKREVKKEKMREIQDELDRKKEEERLAKLKEEEELKRKETEEKERIEKEKEEARNKELEAKEQAKKEREEARLKAIEEKKQKALAAKGEKNEAEKEENVSKVEELPVEQRQSESQKSVKTVQSKPSDEEKRLLKEKESLAAAQAMAVKQESQEKEKQLAEAKKIEKMRKLEEQKAAKKRVDEERLAKKMQKEKAALEAKEKKAESLKRKEDIKKLKNDLAQVYSDAVGLYKLGNYDLSYQKFKQFEDLLAANNPNLESNYLKKMRSRLDRDRENLNALMKNERESKMAESEKQKAATQQKIVQLSQERNRELKELEKKIKADEERLAKEKEKEEQRLKALKQKEEERLRQEKAKAEAEEKMRQEAEEKKKAEEFALLQKEEIAADETTPVDKYVDAAVEVLDEESLVEALDSAPLNESPSLSSKPKHIQKKELSKEERRRLEEQKRAELKQLVKDRENELRKERERVQQELQSSLEELYQRAINLHKSGMNSQAIHILEQVEEMMPGYKKTKHLIQEYRLDELKAAGEPVVEPVKETKRSKNKKISKTDAKYTREVDEALNQYYDEKMDAAQTLKSREDIIHDALNSVEMGL